MISVVIPTLNSEATLGATLTALVPGVIDGMLREVIVVDGGSTDRTLKIAEACGADIVTTPTGRGEQLAAGAARARFPWLLFLHADTVLDDGWEREVATHIERVENGARATSAAAFTFALDDIGFAPRWLEFMVRLRCFLFRLPYGDQGLLLPRTLYTEIGGYRTLPLMEDVDIVRRLGRRLGLLRTRAVTSSIRYRRDGYFARVLRNQLCLILFYLRVPATRIAAIYEPRRPSPDKVPTA